MTGDPRRDTATLIEEIVAKDPATALYLPLAERLREEGRVDEALRLCEERHDRPGSGVGDRIVLGRCYLAAGRLADARRAFEGALALDRENVAALKALAGILAHEGEHARAADLYAAVCRVDPGDLESQSALHQITSGEYPEARLPEIVIGQGDVAWEPVRLPREEEHLGELSLGLRTIESFDADAPAASGDQTQDYRELTIEAIDLETSGGSRIVPAPAEAAREEAAPAEAAPEEAGPAETMAARLRAEVARARKAPVEKSVDQNRSAFQDWLGRIGRGTDR